MKPNQKSLLLSRRRTLLYGLLLGASTLFPGLSLAKNKKAVKKKSTQKTRAKIAKKKLVRKKVAQKTAVTSNLQKKLNAFIQKMRKEKRISASETTAWSVYDFNSGKKLVAINENRLMQAASMIKPFVAVAYFYLNEQNPIKYPYHEYHKNLMIDMLVYSDNDATNKLMKLCKGPRNIKRLCQLSGRNRFANLHFVEYIPKGGKTYRNKISARDYSRLLFALWNYQLVGSRKILDIMGIDNHDRIRGEELPASVKVYDKTGSTSMLCGEMGIVQMGKHNQAYTFIGIIQRSKRTKKYLSWVSDRSDVMRDVSALVYNHMKKTY